jgi:peptide/nickel transport system ATP-binding protein
MYAGEVVERASVDALFTVPQHPYTVGLLGSIPRLDRRTTHLATIEGMVPNMTAPPQGCRFAARCPFVEEACTAAPPPLSQVGPAHWSRCIRAPLEGLVS